MKREEITFSFGENWKNYLERADEQNLKLATKQLCEWLTIERIKDANILDLGSGSGIHSLAFYNLGASYITSVDYDENSVEATRKLWRKVGSPSNWNVLHGSVLDKSFLESLGKFDIVYSWGVLHHTGSMWEAIQNCIGNVKENRFFLISIYVKGNNYERDLNRKKRYNKSGKIVKKIMEFWYYILPLMTWRVRWGLNPFKWNRLSERGMFVYNDIVDWLGGLPYEVATTNEIVSFFHSHKFELIRVKEYQEGYCNEYLFQKKD